MEKLNLNKKNTTLLEKISSIKIFNSISNYLNDKKKYIISLFLSDLNFQFQEKLEKESNILINSDKIDDNYKKEIKTIIELNNFYKSCKKVYKEYIKNKAQFADPLIEIYNNINKSGYSLILNFNKYFYHFLSNVSPYINLSPFCSLMNIIYYNEYYKKIKKEIRPKIVNLILYLDDEIVISRINDLFGELILKPNDYVIKNKSIIFNGETFIKIISDLYKLFDEPLKIILNGNNKNIKQNFVKKDIFIVEGILFKLKFKSNSLLIIYRV